LVLLIVIAIWIPIKIHNAKVAVATLCSEFKVGDPFEKFEGRAIELGFDRVIKHNRELDNPKTLSAMKTGFAFYRYFCTIEYSEGRVTEAKLSTLD